MCTEKDTGGTRGVPTPMGKSKEHKLIRAAASGDLDAATSLIRAHQGGVFCYIKKMCGRDDIAEDVTQEAFSRVLLNLDRFDYNYRFSTWLFTIARRVYLNIREKKWPTADTDRLNDSFARGADISEGMEAGEFRAKSRDLLQRALLSLASEQREIVVLFHQHDWPIWMIADQLGCPEGTVKSHLFRGRLKLRDEYLRLEAAENVTVTNERTAARQAAASSLNSQGRTRVQVKHDSVHAPKGSGATGGLGMRSVPVNAKSSIFEAVQPTDPQPGITSGQSCRHPSAPERSASSTQQKHDEMARAEIEAELSKSGIYAAVPLRTDSSGRQTVHGETWS
jgi:RNA polymerase sigma-70 factor (ECF subfamily)